MTPEQAAQLIKRARELDSKATPGPWLYNEDDGYSYQGPIYTKLKGKFDIPDSILNIDQGYRETDEPSIDIDYHDGRFIAQSRQLVPDLANALETALDENERFRERFQKICDLYEREMDCDNPMEYNEITEIMYNWAYYGLHPSIKPVPIRESINLGTFACVSTYEDGPEPLLEVDKKLEKALETLEAERRDRAEVRKAALLEAAKLVCLRCSRDAKLLIWKDRYHHQATNGLVWCDANKIHKLLVAESKATEQPQPDQGQE